MKKPFVYGVSVEGENFTDREMETKRLKLNFENGVNSILISNRRMGKTSLVRHVQKLVDGKEIKVVYMDIYKCRTAYDFYEKFASSIIQATETKMEKMTHTPEEVLNLPELIAKKRGISIVVCIDEFQQLGEFPDTISVQRQIRSVWQHQRLTSYCLFGSKKHLMSTLFYSQSMPFYQFGDMFYLKKITTEKWIPFIINRFAGAGKHIDEKLARRICEIVDNYSAYVQQLAWNILAVTEKQVTEESFNYGLEETLAQVTPLFVEKTNALTTYQLNFIRAICQGYHREFGKAEVTSQYDMGTRSNLEKIKKGR